MEEDPAALPGSVLIDVAPEYLPAALRARLVRGGATMSSDRFRPAARPSIIGPIVWTVLFSVVGVACLWATIATGFDADAGGSRFVYAGLAGVFLLGAAFSARALTLAVVNRRRGSRLGCHVIAREGLLIAEQGRCTWVPRESMPAPVDDPSSDTRFGAGRVIFVFADRRGGLKKWGVARVAGRELDLWRREGVMPNWV